jgi:predicted Rossmann-fold nucleotide-binding protein
MTNFADIRLFTKPIRFKWLLVSLVMEWNVEKIISGGQTGVDRAALDVAAEFGIPCGGWCPRGRRAEDGIIPPKYPLEETSSPDYPQRTEMNIQDSDGTLILTYGHPVGGTLLTLRLARKHHKPYLLIDLGEGGEALKVQEWLKNSGVQTLNVAGPRESEAPGIHARALNFLQTIFAPQCRK